MGMKEAFNAYMKHAWMADEYLPVSEKGENSFGGNGLTIIDSLDTLYLMGLSDEYRAAKHFVEHDFAFHGRINVFEHTIRVLGGLLSAYSLTHEGLFLEKAELVGEALLGAFANRIPCAVLMNGLCRSQPWANGKSINAEVGTLAIEFVALSRFTGDARWAQKIDAINTFWSEHDDALLKMFIDPKTERMSGKATIGGGIDSTYEYFLKLHKLNGDVLAGRLYRKFEGMIVKELLPKSGRVFEHLGCFMGGMLILGETYSKEGLAVTETCARMYTTNPSGLACDKVKLESGGRISCLSDVYLLRPEVAESIFYAWRSTHDEKWRLLATQIWGAIKKHCQLANGAFTDVRYVSRDTPQKLDKQESWFLAETLKYLWLTFQPDTILPLDEFVFNTEAHPINTMRATRFRV
tara:strand:+ start:4929 stop:6152 length:1224 start_codon:yes stop_codon:yes gene_type:complete